MSFSFCASYCTLSENNRILSVMMDGDNEEQILKVAKSVKQIK